jgi:serpin B
MLELPYKGDNMSMFILLPDDGYLAALERSLTPENLSSWQQAMRAEGELNIQLPRFKIDCRYDLKNVLRAMGMPSAFSANDADFSGIDGNPHNLYISASAHQANIDVNEKGTEAAAATHVVGTPAGIPPSFIADHPFIFLIQDKTTGTILFMGRVSDPTAK